MGSGPVDLGRPWDVDPPAPLEDRVWALTFEHSPVGMALVNLDGTWGRVNQSLCRMLGYTSEQLGQMTFQDITHPDDLEQDLELLAECVAGVRSDYRLLKRYLHADGGTVWGDLSVALVRHDDGSAMHFVSQILDVSQQQTDRARLEDLATELSAVNQDLELFAAVVGHDLKTPLSSLRACLELVVDDLVVGEVENSSPMTLRLARQAEASTERMAALIDALLAYTTIGPANASGRGRLEITEPTPMSDVVDAAVADVAVLVRSTGTTIRVDASVAAAPTVLASAALVRTMVVNLLVNAVKYRSPDRPLTVWIGARPDPTTPGQLEVSIRNDGPEIPAEDRERIFGLFVRGDSNAELLLDEAALETVEPGRDVAGFGIGLAACRRIIAWHHGHIWITQPETGGVEVHLTLPLTRSS